MQTTHKPAATHTLAIDGMSGDTCVTKVKSALHSVPAVTTQSVGVGSAVIDANQQGCDAACAAISGAGYRATENTAEKPHDKKPISGVELKSGPATGGATTKDGTRTNDAAVNTSGKPIAPKM